MAVTVTAYRVVPFPFFTLTLWAIERYVEIDGVETNKQAVAIFWIEAEALEDVSTLPRYNTMRWED